ncbi:MAG: hypothetical protein RLZZ336_429 [Cyanobacteriota bacterium]|jgi:uncharacterized protein (TIGR03792 family)
MAGWGHRRWINALLALALLLGGLLLPGTPPTLAASGDYDVVLVEHLRVKVPAEAVQAWIQAERGSWEPWLEAQPGFLDRQLLWDPEREEGTLLIHWRSRADWQTIPDQEIALVQQRFEQLAQHLTGSQQGNPFPLLFEGELLPQ